MTDIDPKALALRVADAFQSISDDRGTIQIWNCQIGTAEARALAAFLREAVSEPAKITPEQLSRAMRPDIWADDCRNMVVPREGQDENEVVAIVRETHLRWAEDAISRLYPPPPARIEDAEEPSHECR